MLWWKTKTGRRRRDTAIGYPFTSLCWPKGQPLSKLPDSFFCSAISNVKAYKTTCPFALSCFGPFVLCFVVKPIKLTYKTNTTQKQRETLSLSLSYYALYSVPIRYFAVVTETEALCSKRGKGKLKAKALHFLSFSLCCIVLFYIRISSHFHALKHCLSFSVVGFFSHISWVVASLCLKGFQRVHLLASIEDSKKTRFVFFGLFKAELIKSPFWYFWELHTTDLFMLLLKSKLNWACLFFCCKAH